MKENPLLKEIITDLIKIIPLFAIKISKWNYLLIPISMIKLITVTIY